LKKQKIESQKLKMGLKVDKMHKKPSLSISISKITNITEDKNADYRGEALSRMKNAK
jgi:hypothetical protein